MSTTEYQGDGHNERFGDSQRTTGPRGLWIHHCLLAPARRERRGPRFLKVGKLVRYRRADIEAYLSAHAVETADRRASRVQEQ